MTVRFLTAHKRRIAKTLSYCIGAEAPSATLAVCLNPRSFRCTSDLQRTLLEVGLPKAILTECCKYVIGIASPRSSARRSLANRFVIEIRGELPSRRPSKSWVG